jgi:hypothetical protein
MHVLAEEIVSGVGQGGAPIASSRRHRGRDRRRTGFPVPMANVRVRSMSPGWRARQIDRQMYWLDGSLQATVLCWAVVTERELLRHVISSKMCATSVEGDGCDELA